MSTHFAVWEQGEVSVAANIKLRGPQGCQFTQTSLYCSLDSCYWEARNSKFQEGKDKGWILAVLPLFYIELELWVPRCHLSTKWLNLLSREREAYYPTLVVNWKLRYSCCMYARLKTEKGGKWVGSKVTAGANPKSRLAIWGKGKEAKNKKKSAQSRPLNWCQQLANWAIRARSPLMSDLQRAGGGSGFSLLCGLGNRGVNSGAGTKEALTC